MNNNYAGCLKKYVTFQGYATKKECLHFIAGAFLLHLFLLVVSLLAVYAIEISLPYDRNVSERTYALVVGTPQIAGVLFHLVPFLSLSTRRLRDIRYSPYHLLLLLIPVLGLIVVWVVLLTKKTKYKHLYDERGRIITLKNTKPNRIAEIPHPALRKQNNFVSRLTKNTNYEHSQELEKAQNEIRHLSTQVAALQAQVFAYKSVQEKEALEAQYEKRMQEKNAQNTSHVKYTASQRVGNFHRWEQRLERTEEEKKEHSTLANEPAPTPTDNKITQEKRPPETPTEEQATQPTYTPEHTHLHENPRGWIDDYLLCMSQYAHFKGRTSRWRYWKFIFFVNLIALAPALLDLTFGTAFARSLFGLSTPTLVPIDSDADISIIESLRQSYQNHLPFGYFFSLYMVAHFVPMLSAQVRRLRDAKISVWLVLLNVIPVLGQLALVILCLQKRAK